ncbi:hypothetical protein [Bradymonas sediminis]|uniref:hypothetical protein n=1 Tax=Bradymonas sediminis TaxID=1548548 RepID=UPI00105BBEA2|nr:hypothetical protein [Bradymonas sediminis]TDP75228.1 hypothetical protein DFR33_10493 [Bradymonas sediminis]
MRLVEKDILSFACVWFDRLFAGKFRGRVYLAGGAFKSVLHGRPPNDLDLFAATDPGRQALLDILQQNGAIILQDNKPYQTILSWHGQRVELAYSTQYQTLSERLAQFDLDLSAVGVEYDDGRLHPEIHPVARESLVSGEVLLIKPLKNWKYVLATLERMRRYARELDLVLPKAEINYIWSIFEDQPLEMQRGMIERFRLVGRDTQAIQKEAECRIHP